MAARHAFSRLAPALANARNPAARRALPVLRGYATESDHSVCVPLIFCWRLLNDFYVFTCR